MYKVQNSLSIYMTRQSRINIFWHMELPTHMTLKQIKLLKQPNTIDFCPEKNIFSYSKYRQFQMRSPSHGFKQYECISKLTGQIKQTLRVWGLKINKTKDNSLMFVNIGTARQIRIFSRISFGDGNGWIHCNIWSLFSTIIATRKLELETKHCIRDRCSSYICL